MRGVSEPNDSNLQIDPSFRRWLGRALLGWFRRHQRDLPWRKSRDPYAIWVSEVMLQQTQVATVVPYFQRFLEALPDIAALAAADEEQVLRLWEGLGYYRRARDLHRAARRLVSEHGGRLPDDPDVLRSLPGFGRYTVGAVLSQAFDRPLPILEVNSLRLLSRLFALRGDPRKNPLQRQLWHIAEAILPRRHIGAFNQALMELGALVCTVSAPRCLICPLHERCAARQKGLQEEIPQPAAPRTVVEEHEVAVVVRRGGKVLIAKRPAKARRWAGLWEFPHDRIDPAAPAADQAADLLRQLTGIDAKIGPAITTIRHGVTRFDIVMECLEATYARGRFRSDFYEQGAWVKPEELHVYPFSSPQRILAARAASAE